MKPRMTPKEIVAAAMAAGLIKPAATYGPSTDTIINRIKRAGAKPLPVRFVTAAPDNVNGAREKYKAQAEINRARRLRYVVQPSQPSAPTTELS